MNIVLIYTIKEADSGRSIAAFLMDSGYFFPPGGSSSKHRGSFLLNGKTVFPTQSFSRKISCASMSRRKKLPTRLSLFPWTSPSFLKTNMFS